MDTNKKPMGRPRKYVNETGKSQSIYALHNTLFEMQCIANKKGKNSSLSIEYEKAAQMYIAYCKQQEQNNQ